MTDIVDRIRQKAPTAIDTFAADIERRNGLTDDKVNRILHDIFTKIDPDRLNPALSYRYHDIKKRLS